MEKEAKIFSMPVAVVIGAIIISAGIYFGLHSSSLTPTSPTVGAAAQGQQQAQGNNNVPTIDVKQVSTDGEPYVGNPNAPVTIAYWYDYQCPFCKQDEQNAVTNIVSDYVNSGKVRIIFKDYPFLGPDSITLAATARAVWSVDPGKFYAWHKAMFDAQGQEGSGWATTAKINEVTASALGATEAAQVAGLMTSSLAKYTALVNADKAEGTKLGIVATPSMLVNTKTLVGAEPYATVQSAIEAALKS